jgi:hypothetical protein
MQKWEYISIEVHRIMLGEKDARRQTFVPKKNLPLDPDVDWYWITDVNGCAMVSYSFINRFYLPEQKALDVLGDLGWEMITCRGNLENCIYNFKRPKEV